MNAITGHTSLQWLPHRLPPLHLVGPSCTRSKVSRPIFDAPVRVDRQVRVDSTGATPDTLDSSGGVHPQYRYNSGDGRPKASMEDAHWTGTSGPWQVSWQMNERNLVWTEDLRNKMLQRYAWQKLGLTEEEAKRRLEELACIVPGIESRMSAMKADILVGFLSDTAGLAVRLISLKQLFPRGDPAQMVLARPSLALSSEGLEAVQEAAERLRTLLPGVDVDRLVTEHPSMLDVDEFERAVAESQRILPGLDVCHIMEVNPSLIFRFQRGSQLIPYDEPGSDG
eukprot:jgi/Botrbrau1/22216/Bobra.168_1s0047.1